MQNLRVTIVQVNQIWEDKEENYIAYKRLLKKTETNLILLPEMFQTGFSMNTDALKESYFKSKSMEWLKSLAKEKNAAIYTSLIIEENDSIYNRGVFIFPDRKSCSYDKRKLFSLAGEDKIFTAGNSETIVNYLGWTLQLQICYDLRFPEIVRNRILPNKKPAYDAILYVANWPNKRRLHWNTLLKARAIENQCYVLGANRVGEDEKKHHYSGDSQMISPLGRATKLIKNKEEVRTFVLEKTKLNLIREKVPFLKDK